MIGAMERGGKAVAAVIERTDPGTLNDFVHAVVAPTATVSTDEHAGYRHLSRTYAHGLVRHSAGEHARDGHHTNGIESFWALLKRQIIGIHHHISAKQTNGNVAEATWYFNERKTGEGERVNALLASTNGRLTYKALIA